MNANAIRARARALIVQKINPSAFTYISTPTATLSSRSTSNLVQTKSQIGLTFRSRHGPPQRVRSLHQYSANRRTTTDKFVQLRSHISRRWKSEDSALDSVPTEKLSLSQRLKKMSRDYGWTAVYVYLILSALDFPFCFLAVKWLGTDTIGHWEHVITSYVKDLFPWTSSSMTDAAGDAVQDHQAPARLLEENVAQDTITDHGYQQALKANSGSDASIWTQLGLAYAIHKSFIFVRVPLTAAILPKVVKTLRGWGWNIGRPSSKAIRNAASKKSAKSGVNTKGSDVKPDD